VSQVSKLAGCGRDSDLEIGDTAGLETLRYCVGNAMKTDQGRGGNEKFQEKFPA
jgi:hypothetical protein